MTEASQAHNSENKLVQAWISNCEKGKTYVSIAEISKPDSNLSKHLQLDTISYKDLAMCPPENK